MDEFVCNFVASLVFATLWLMELLARKAAQAAAREWHESLLRSQEQTAAALKLLKQATTNPHNP